MTKEELNSHSESGILRAAATGDPGAFEALCQDILPPLLKFIQRKCPRMGIAPDLAEDFVHDSIVKAIQWLRDHKDAVVHAGWLRQVTVHIMKDWRRREQLEKAAKRETFDPEKLKAPLPDDGTETEDHERVRNAFVHLSPANQAVLRLVLLDGLDTKTAAKAMGIGEWAAYKRYARALSKLRTLLKR